MAKIRCPYCDTKTGRPSEVIYLANTMGCGIGGFKMKLSDANGWIDVKCPNCERTYSYNFDTKEVRR